MEWILVLYFAFNTGGYKNGGGGGIALDHIEFHTEEQCKSAGEQILENFNSINGYTSVYQARGNKTNRKRQGHKSFLGRRQPDFGQKDL